MQLVLQCFDDVVASCVACLLNIPATDKMLQLRTRKNYWNIFVASWRRQQLCLRQLRPRPLTFKSHTRTRSRIWRSPIIWLRQGLTAVNLFKAFTFNVEGSLLAYWVNCLFGFLVSKETVVLRRWGRSKQKFGFIKWVDKGWITTVKDLESWRFER